MKTTTTTTTTTTNNNNSNKDNKKSSSSSSSSSTYSLPLYDTTWSRRPIHFMSDVLGHLCGHPGYRLLSATSVPQVTHTRTLIYDL